MPALRPVAVLFVTALAATGFPPASADASCPPANSHVWFLAASYDSAERDDFKLDVLTFEAILDELRDVYCIPASQAKVLAMDGSFTIGSTTYSGYTSATEANVKDWIADFGADASDHSDSIFFYFQSSHGNVYTTGISQCGLTRTYGSFAALGGGSFYDCELGAALNANFDSDVRMVVAVDCSFCGGFSDSLTAASGTVPDGAAIASSGVPGANRIVWTGCAMTTECFGGGINGGSVFYDYLRYAMDRGPATGCDGWSSPGFPAFQGVNVPQKGATDGVCTASEWFFGATHYALTRPTDPLGKEQQFRMKYGSGLSSGIQVMA